MDDSSKSTYIIEMHMQVLVDTAEYTESWWNETDYENDVYKDLDVDRDERGNIIRSVDNAVKIDMFDVARGEINFDDIPGDSTDSIEYRLRKGGREIATRRAEH